MSEPDMIEAAAPRRGPGRVKGQRDAVPRRSPALSPTSFLRAAKKAGYGRCTFDADGKMTAEMTPAPAESADGAKGEQSEWSNLHKLADDE